MDNRRKLMARQLASHSTDYIDRLYMSRKEGGRKFASIEDSVDTTIRSLENYFFKKKGKLQLKPPKDQQNNNNEKTKTQRKAILKMFQATNLLNLSRDDFRHG